MKKTRILSGILAAVLALLAVVSACADLKKGSRGDEVKPGADIAGEQKERFEQSWAEAEPDLAEQYGGPEKIRTLEAQSEWLETTGIEKCFDLHGAEPNNAE